MAKRFVNAPDQVVPDLMQGLALDSSRLTLLDPSTGHNVAVRTSIASQTQSRRVSVVSGGGSGHEPMAGGYVGEGMLAAAVAGGVFASPSVPAICAMLDAVAVHSTGILVVVMNYQGDRLNFDMAVKDLQRRAPGYPIQMMLVSDDVALPNALEKRGIAGTIFVLKVAGAAADQGRPLQEVAAIAETAAKYISSYGVALEPCTIPGHAVDLERLGADEIELGMGIHGEPGAEKQNLSQIDRANLTHNLVAAVCSRLDMALHSKKEVVSGCTGLAIMVNNLGAVSQAEMLVVCKAVADFLYNGNAPYLNGNKYRVHMYSGSFMTSLQMTGVSVSCFLLPADNGLMEQLLHAKTACVAWNPGFAWTPLSKRAVVARSVDGRRANVGPEMVPSANVYLPNLQPPTYPATREASAPYVAGPYAAAPVSRPGVAQSGLSRLTEKYIMAITGDLIRHSDELGDLDSKTGDGDLGDTVRRGCERVRSDLEYGRYAPAAGNPAQLFRMIASSIGAMGGSSGVLTTIFLQAAADSFQQRADYKAETSWRAAFLEGTNAIMERGGAVVGDRTLVDALKPAADVLATPGKSIADAAHAARIGCESTKSMTKAKFGRSANVRAGKLLNTPDPGARAVCVILNALVNASATG